MRLQGIPDSFHLASYLSKQYLQVGELELMYCTTAVSRPRLTRQQVHHG